MDALSHPGPAIPTDIPKSVCNEKLMPGINPLTFGPDAAAAAVDTEDSAALSVTSEPALPCYVYATGCGATATKITAPAGCVRSRRLVVKLYALGASKIVRVSAYLDGKRLVARTGRNLRQLVLSRLPASGTHRVKLVELAANHRTHTLSRRYIGCG
jgi:hypothetical protein